MNIIAKLLGLLIAGFGTAIFASPQVTQKIFQFFKEDKRIYIAGVVRAFTGVVLLLAASQSVVPVAAIALGIMFLTSGIVIFACDLEKMKTFMAHYSQMPVLVLRLLGLIAASFGILTFSIF